MHQYGRAPKFSAQIFFFFLITRIMPPMAMDENEYHNLCDALFGEAETLLEDSGADFDSNGNVIEAELSGGEKIVINRQPAMREIWLASPGGGYHFVWKNERWENTRGGEEFFAMLKQLLG